MLKARRTALLQRTRFTHRTSGPDALRRGPRPFNRDAKAIVAVMRHDVSMETMSLAQARRTALAAQGLQRARPRRAGAPTMRDVQRVVDRLGLVQIDSVTVLARAHLVPLYSRLGDYDVGLLDRAAGKAPRRLLEAWAHEASFVAPETYRLLSWRRARVQDDAWGSIRGVVNERPDVVSLVRDLIADQGPLTSTEVHARLLAAGVVHEQESDGWGWNWTVAKTALEYLFFTGEVAAVRRTTSFERVYDLAVRVVPASALEPIDSADAVRGLLELGARAHGVGTLRCFKDYVRLRGTEVKTALAELVEQGVLQPVRIEGWDEPTYLHANATFPRTARASTLLSPFDPLIFERTRLERLFGTRYRLEIYVPAAQRVHGYYVLPFLEGDRITARVDLKADRRGGRLLVESTHSEPFTRPTTALALAEELAVLAGWLGLDTIDVASRGDLAGELRTALSSTFAAG